MDHSDLWHGLDLLAAEMGLSVSGLAKLAKLNPSTFNPSKRQSLDGRGRWPSTESVAKVLDAAGMGLLDFAALVAGARQPAYGQPLPVGRLVPILRLDYATQIPAFDAAGFPSGENWRATSLPAANDPHAYALEINDDSMAPIFRRHDLVVVSPTAPVQPGDRVVLRTARGALLIRHLQYRGSKTLELRGLGADAPLRMVDSMRVAWIHRIMWASQ